MQAVRGLGAPASCDGLGDPLLARWVMSLMQDTGCSGQDW